ncbi:MAG: MerR family transcriptional regulator [Clostridia bacterium]|nr:MerR family transcriptional regulator [Clostridia bacterium]
MKIKEVSEKTELTERAIRLYIENGLVAPNVNESYSGRRNIEFSEEDVGRLKSISVLRKAGFSIAQIKLMQQEPEKSKEVLREFLDKTTGEIKAYSEIVACLTPLLSCEELSADKISQSLEKPVVEEKALPPEDSEPSDVQKLIRKLFFGVGVVGMIFAVLLAIPIVRVEVQYIKAYLYPHYSADSALALLWFFGAVLFPIPLIIHNRKKALGTRKKEKIKTVISALLVALCACCTYFTFAMSFLAGIANPEAYVVSHTTDTKNYMVIDAAEAKDVLLEFLPEELPDVEGIKYDYFYKEYGVWHEPPFTSIYIEIPLDEESFRETVEHYKSFRPSDSVCEPYEHEDGEWRYVYYRKNYEKAPTNYDPVFGYNEKEHKVKLICKYGRIAQKGTRKW